jgi:hypothetical protein
LNWLAFLFDELANQIKMPANSGPLLEEVGPIGFFLKCLNIKRNLP